MSCVGYDVCRTYRPLIGRPLEVCGCMGMRVCCKLSVNTMGGERRLILIEAGVYLLQFLVCLVVRENICLFCLCIVCLFKQIFCLNRFLIFPTENV